MVKDLTIFLLDDDPPTRQLVILLLKHMGVNPVVASSISMAEERLEDCYPDLILLDVDLGQTSPLSGVEYLRKLKAMPRFKYIPIVAFTSYRTETYEADEFDYVLDKVHEATELKALLTTRFPDHVFTPVVNN